MAYDLTARLVLKDMMSAPLRRVTQSLSQVAGATGLATKATNSYRDANGRLRGENGRFVAENKRVAGSFDLLGMSIGKVTGVLGGLALGAAGAGIAMDAFKTAADFESSMSRVGALSGATRAEMALLTEEAKRLGAETVFSASEAAEGMSFLAMAGYRTNDIIAAMPGLLDTAAAGQTELGETADIVSNILSGFGIEASKTGHVADVLTKAFTSSNTDLRKLGYTMKYVAPVAKSLSFSLEETAAAAGLLGNAGIQGEMAGTSLRMGLLRLANPPKEAAKALAKLNVEVTKNGKMKDLATIIEDMSAGMAKLSEADRASFVAEVVGTEAASSFLTLIDAGPEKLREFTRELERSNGAAKQIAARQLDNFNGSVRLLESALESLKINAVGPLLPTFQKITLMLASMAEQYGPQIAETFESVGRSISEFLDPYINDPKTWTVTTQAELKFKQLEMADMAGSGGPPPFWDNLLGRFEDWYAASGRKMLEDGASRLASDFGKFLEDSAPSIAQAGITIGAKIMAGISEGIRNGMAENPIGNAILSSMPVVTYGQKGGNWLIDMFTAPEENPDAKAYHGIDYVRRDGLVTELHEGERVLTKSENREYNSGSGAPVINISMNGLTIREEADIERIAYRIAREINEGT
ncbi:phage tail tape measure protein [Brevibacillus panacihumi]|uniref:phage tail tape measure protein n=1 Tax=Brevibacillus panacihumi TaxID=497735 RepID=UPI003D02BDE5